MELLYVVELGVRASDAGGIRPTEVRGRVLEHVVDWLSYGRTTRLLSESFESSGKATLLSDSDGRADLRASWSIEGTNEVTALVVTTRTEITQSGRADFVCIVTIFTEEERTSVRIELARESLDGVLAPAGIDFFRRPHLLVLLLRDRDLQCWAGPSRVDGRFNWVNPKHVDFIWEAISVEKRLLPILLVDGSDEEGEKLARRAAGELAGLAPVLAVDVRSQHLLEDRLAEINASIPRGGARLVWPDLVLRHPVFTSDQAPFAAGRLLRMLSSVSVTVRGVNHLLRKAAAAQRSARNEQIAADLAAAKAQGDLSREVDAQARAIAELKSEVEQYESWFRQVEEERDSYKAQAAQAAYWRQEAERARQAAGVRDTDWAEAPALDPADLTELASFLEKQSQGAIVFTREARQAWKRDAYPRIDAMRDALITLTRAAIDYSRLGCQLGMHPDDWFKQEWELTLASTDKYMSKNGLDTFTLDGKEYSRLPHLKLGDHTSPNEVGRVYFAMDSDGERFIVDHVGLKLYGL
ncbi:hypothetical protein FFT09_09225 [Saccharomonospora piscinae]|uniref:hypothetical protein n=1 Tax=Saccharomonospora piscinae TaxID=687388 RepID=UPI0011074F2C|nr:hypothetical protein [Saccharomonospora piscinae]TLW93554.1 hypothetical protein FFT09_09225 [Saccharomonospora piscinae]